MTDKMPEVEIAAVDKRTGETASMAVLEDTDTAFDPTRMHLDLTKAEKRRTTALLMAIQAYQHLIIKDADYLRAASDLARRNEGPVIQPATMNAMVEAAINFDHFIAGHFSEVPTDKPIGGGSQTEAEPSDPTAPFASAK
jgi:hypothetical protein